MSLEEDDLDRKARDLARATGATVETARRALGVTSALAAKVGGPAFELYLFGTGYAVRPKPGGPGYRLTRVAP